MTAEDRLLFACTRQNFADPHREIVHELCRGPLSWNKIYATADAHAVAPLIYSNLRLCEAGVLRMPCDIAEQFETELYRNIVAKEKIASRIAEVLAYLNQKGIQVLLVKGAALDVLVYAQPWYTVANDVDLIFQERTDEPEVQAFLDALGTSRDIQFEYDFYGHHDISINGILPINFEEIWADAVEIRYRAAKVEILSPEDMLIASCINSCRRRFFRLKALCDVAEIVNTQRNLDWARLADKAKKYQCQTIVHAALYAAQITVGCNLDPSNYERLAVHPARARVIRSLCDRMSFSSLDSLFNGTSLFHRNLNPALFTPYATYTPQQAWKKFRFVWSNR